MTHIQTNRNQSPIIQPQLASSSGAKKETLYSKKLSYCSDSACYDKISQSYLPLKNIEILKSRLRLLNVIGTTRQTAYNFLLTLYCNFVSCNVSEIFNIECSSSLS